MQFERFLENANFILTEGSIYERLRRNPLVEFDPDLAHAALIYNDKGSEILAQFHREYIEIGQKYQLPMVVLTNTWRANKERINRSKFRDFKINQDNVNFIFELCRPYRNSHNPIFIGGVIGPRGDAYKPDLSMNIDTAESFHSDQLLALLETQIDFLMAATLPALSEALGIARAMAVAKIPYFLSFVIRKNGRLLDGTPLDQAIEKIDTNTPVSPTGYFVNCVHPKVLLSAFDAVGIQKGNLAERIVGFQANTSPKSPEDLDGIEELESEDPEIFGSLMLEVYEKYRMPILGGCCGTDARHMESLAKKLKGISD
ncbi:homocysteine S-methyltransferase family protein [candidate division KSB1 bacterium]|nr:homocysteine S-methyltransferase family protein [candidate division KSB1 bacterium]